MPLPRLSLNPIDDEESFTDLEGANSSSGGWNQQPTFLQGLWKNRELIGQGTLFAADAIASYQNNVNQTNELENRMRATFQQKPIWDYNAQYGDNQPLIKAPNGAEVRTTLLPAAPVEIEGGEFLILPDATLEIAKGPKHSKGGVDTILPEGTKIFSNKLKPKKSKETFAELAIKNDYTKHKKALENPYSNVFTRTAAERMLVRKQEALDQLFNEQQDMNGDSNGQRMENGGTPDFVRLQGPRKMSNFEQRMYNPSQSLYSPEGPMTHKMMSWESDGKYYAAPTVVEKDGELMQLSEDDAIDYAFQTGEFKEFKTDAEARKYAEGDYKKGTPLANMAKGGSTGPKPIYVNKRNDPRLQRYNDSMNLYNMSVEGKEKIQDPSTHWLDWWEYTARPIPDKVASYNRLAGYNGVLPKPIDTLKRNFSGNEAEMDIYKKPVQPVKYKPATAPDAHKMELRQTMTKRPDISEKPIETKPWTVDGPDYWGATPSTPTTTPSTGTAPEQKWFSIGLGNKILVDDKYMTDSEFEDYKKSNPNIQFNQKPDSTGRTYKPKMERGGKTCYDCGGKIKYEEGGEYDLSPAEIKKLIKEGYKIEIL